MHAEQRSPFAPTEVGAQTWRCFSAWPWVPAFAGTNGRECITCLAKQNQVCAFWQNETKRVRIRAASNRAHRLEPRARVDLGLREHWRLRPEALDNAAYERPGAGRGDEHWRFAGAGGLLEAFAHQRNELGQAGGLHRQILVVALADDRF